MLQNKSFQIKRLNNSIKFYLPRTEGYMEVIKDLSSEYMGMSLIEFDGYFERKVEPAKYVMVQVHVDKMIEENIIDQANAIRNKLRQRSLAIELNNELILVEEK